MALQNKVQLMTYPDSLGGDLQKLKTVLDTHLKDAVDFVHILPPYPSSADRGFCPLTHLEIDPKFGDWSDVEALTEGYQVMLDLICGHISDQSEYFLDYKKNGMEGSEYADMFLPLEKVFKDKNITLDELNKMCYLTPKPPFIQIKFDNDKVVMHWNTFQASQIELDVYSPKTRELFIEFIANLAKHKVKYIRLDAIQTVAKDAELGTYMIPETYEFIEWMIAETGRHGITCLCEIFGSAEIRKKVVEMGALVYDFQMSDVILYTVLSQSFRAYINWITQNDFENIITVLTNHDGLNIIPQLEALDRVQLKYLRENLFANAGESTQKASGVGHGNIAADAINATLMEAVFRDQDSWFMAHALHLFAPGTPQVYYNDLLGQRNDEELYKDTGEGRSLIRHNHKNSTLDHKFRQPFVQRLIKLMKLRNSHSAFQGNFEVKPIAEDKIEMLWFQSDQKISLKADLRHMEVDIQIFNPDSNQFEDFEL